MKKAGILNSDISRVLSYLGHTDTICIGDCGLPIPDEVERIDLALCFGEPTFMRTLEIVAADMKIEKIVPDCGLCVIKGTGHWSFVERPQEAQAILRSFLP